VTIPKIIHYCWFGKGDKPKAVTKYINGWRKTLPEYEIMEWNEENFNIEINQYVREAYQEKKYAFVSDYARLLALYSRGGIYLDTDVEIFKNFDDLLHNDVVLGFEEKNFIATSTIIARKGSQLIHDFMSLYHDKSFISADGHQDLTTNVTKLTSLLEGYGLQATGNTQNITITEQESVLILDRTKFSPFDYLNQKDFTDNTTYAIHHFGATWAPATFKYKKILKSCIIKLLGSENYKKISSSRK